ncbi:MAG: LysR family transcriptional regulator [Neisseriaceae bacterium]|nr:LysR family transcriptional regulator [Neisseriaceae bacterium]
MTPISLRQLQIFIAIEQQASTVQAAQVLNLSQSAVSTALGELERLLGVSLFDRVGRRLLPNEHARVLYPKALALLEGAHEVASLFAAGAALIHIGASTTIGNYLLPARLAAYRATHPLVNFKVTVANSREIVAAQAHLAYDLALIEGRFSHPDVCADVWQTDEMVLFAAPQSRWLPDQQAPLTLPQLAQVPFIVREAGSGTRETVEQLLLQYVPNGLIGMELGHSEAIKHAVRHDLGVGCLSRHVIAEDLAAGLLQEWPIASLSMQRSLWLLKHRQKHASAALTGFEAFLRRHEG